MRLTKPLRTSARQAIQKTGNPDGHCINSTVYGCLLRRCTERRLVRQAKQLHARLILSYSTSDNFLASKLITFYSSTHHLIYARSVFDQIPGKNTFSFNALLIAFSQHKYHTETLKLFSLFFSQTDSRNLVDMKPDSFTMSCVLKAMSEVVLDGPLLARMVHCYVIKHRFDSDVFVGNGLVTYYSRCDDMLSASNLFDEMPVRDLVSWNSMISGYSQGGFYKECKDLYKKMLLLKDLRPNGITVVSIMQACAQSSDLILGMEVHKYVVKNRIEIDLSLCNSFIALYAKCGSLDYARELFEEMSEKDEVTYGAIISGYMVHGFVDEAMRLFTEMRNPGLSTWNAVISGEFQNNRYENVVNLARQMQDSGFKPNGVTLSTILPTFSHLSHLKGGKEIHAYAIKNSYDGNIYVSTALIDTYAKLGFVDGAQSVFDRANHRSLIVWTAIISAYAAHGDANFALTLFDEMLNSGIQPDPVTFTAILSACAHAGLVEEAEGIFDSMLPKYGIRPLIEHYACMVGVLSRAGKLSEAVELIKKMPIEPNARAWGALLNGASIYGDIELAEFACARLFEMEPENTGNFIIMANLYSNAAKCEEAVMVREKLNNTRLKKVAGCSWIETTGGTHSFIARDMKNERTDEIFEMLGRLLELMRGEGYTVVDEFDEVSV
ncbi:pentatricopeptide repeat-containing At2g37310 [Olea europaea subsp. europaea]|uniref:Pentatricopeptide repeat-containing At2g37310 n=1 Tax=Olea europaea subsp. europaea TaxID=158383 RepID=A0A8S0UAM8_OLEEU|nr:pentatricopeptide repeat-containing At2g37310 [Olea europaea subsp. europaea]